mmetsp:Transcript_29071/g.73857  ORF Transcript_29071/g.73857 Transcript_29071/m.73857 type:complete len:224 (+) Transcript_29071:498-1169(+)
MMAPQTFATKNQRTQRGMSSGCVSGSSSSTPKEGKAHIMLRGSGWSRASSVAGMGALSAGAGAADSAESRPSSQPGSAGAGGASAGAAASVSSARLNMAENTSGGGLPHKKKRARLAASCASACMAMSPRPRPPPSAARRLAAQPEAAELSPTAKPCGAPWPPRHRERRPTAAIAVASRVRDHFADAPGLIAGPRQRLRGCPWRFISARSRGRGQKRSRRDAR